METQEVGQRMDRETQDRTSITAIEKKEYRSEESIEGHGKLCWRRVRNIDYRPDQQKQRDDIVSKSKGVGVIISLNDWGEQLYGS
ncbi:hypothetical protein Tco_0668132 [Tanacetum coccineum]